MKMVKSIPGELGGSNTTSVTVDEEIPDGGFGCSAESRKRFSSGFLAPSWRLMGTNSTALERTSESRIFTSTGMCMSHRELMNFGSHMDQKCLNAAYITQDFTNQRTTCQLKKLPLLTVTPQQAV